MTKNLAVPSLIALSSLTSFIASAALNVSLPIDGVELSYELPVRLDTVLKDTNQHGIKNATQSYVLANQLFNLDKQSQADELKLSVLAELEPLKNSTDNELREFAYLMTQQITDWNVGYREPVSLDYDYVRIQASANPMLKGNYQFITPARATSISLEGLFFASPQFVDFSSKLEVSNLIDNARTLNSAHNSYAWIIYPDGHYQRVGYAQWNKQHTQLAPGSTVYLGLNSDSHQMISLEEKIVQLITMRKAL